VFALAGRAIMSIFGPEFTMGAVWLAVVALGCAVWAFVGLAEPILTLQRPSLNLLNAVVAAAITIGANLILIARLGPIGAGVGTLITGVVYGVLRYVEISRVLSWRWPWASLSKPVIATALALPLALAARAATSASAGQVLSVSVFLVGYIAAWRSLGIEDADRQVIEQLFRRPRPATMP
jgi:O-antigen/teichoic acid export membrane protein